MLRWPGITIIKSRWTARLSARKSASARCAPPASLRHCSSGWLAGVGADEPRAIRRRSTQPRSANKQAENPFAGDHPVSAAGRGFGPVVAQDQQLALAAYEQLVVQFVVRISGCAGSQVRFAKLPPIAKHVSIL